jgi:uncharacterized protein YukE
MADVTTEVKTDSKKATKGSRAEAQASLSALIEAINALREACTEDGDVAGNFRSQLASAADTLTQAKGA